MNYIKSLDGIRALAITMVILFHFFYEEIRWGWIGVQIFFTLSGFLITSILLENTNKSLKKYLTRFYWRRAIRIFPIYYLYIGAVSIIYIVTASPISFKETWVYLITYTYNYYPLIALDNDRSSIAFPHFWSLCVEEQFYLVWPVIVYFFNRKQLKYVVCIIIILSPILRFLLADHILSFYSKSEYVVGKIIYQFTLCQLDSFAFGAAIPIFKLNKNVKNTDKMLLLIFALMLVIGSIQFFYSTGTSYGINYDFNTFGYEMYNMKYGQHVWSYTLLGLFSLLLILNAIRKTFFLKNFLENKILVHIGRISYGLYIYHFILSNIFIKLIEYGLNKNLGFITFLIVTYFVSLMSFKFIEGPLLSKFKNNV